jgi:hypothetical protein
MFRGDGCDEWLCSDCAHECDGEPKPVESVQAGGKENKITLQDLIGFAGYHVPCVITVAAIDFNRLCAYRLENTGIELLGKNGLTAGTMLLLNHLGNGLRVHNPGDKMYWRDK